jgi:hypothetical protein
VLFRSPQNPKTPIHESEAIENSEQYRVKRDLFINFSSQFRGINGTSGAS